MLEVGGDVEPGLVDEGAEVGEGEEAFLQRGGADAAVGLATDREGVDAGDLAEVAAVDGQGVGYTFPGGGDEGSVIIVVMGRLGRRLSGLLGGSYCSLCREL